MVNCLEELLGGYVQNVILLNICEFLFLRAIRCYPVKDNSRAGKTKRLHPTTIFGFRRALKVARQSDVC